MKTVEDKVEEQVNKPRHTFLDKMDAIAYGVEARYELITGHSRRVTEETVAIARELGVSEDEIERWAASRLICDTAKVRVIKSLLKRLQGGSLANRVSTGEGSELGNHSPPYLWHMLNRGKEVMLNGGRKDNCVLEPGRNY